MKSEVIDSMIPSWRSRMNVCIYICVTAYPGVHMSPCWSLTCRCCEVHTCEHISVFSELNCMLCKDRHGVEFFLVFQHVTRELHTINTRFF